MKSLLVTLALCLSTASFAETRVFEGYIKDSAFPTLDGLKCHLELEEAELQGSEKIAFVAKPKIKDTSHIFAKKKAPLPKMRINDIAAGGDTYTTSSDNVLVGIGSKYRGEISQRLYVYFNEEGKVSSWSYRDGTHTAYGFTYTCAK